MNKLPLEKRVLILTALAEGSSMRSTARLAGVSFNTVVKLLIDAGKACARYQHEKMRNLKCDRLQVDEIWSFCAMKAKNVPDERKGEWGIGDIWTFAGICADTKLVPCWLVGLRDAGHATHFLKDLASRLTKRIQLTTDGHKMYLEAVENAFAGQIDFAQLIKVYGSTGDETRYSPPECIGCESKKIEGDPDPDHISTSFIERQNLTMRMRMRRFTRLTNAFSKKVENLEHAIALFYMHYNFIQVHKTLKKTPAMAAGVTNHRWTMEDVIAMMERLQENQNSN